MSIRGACWLLAVLLLLAPAAVIAQTDEQAQLAKLRTYVSEMQAQVERLQKALSGAERRIRQQSDLIDRLEADFDTSQACGPADQERIRQRFFARLDSRVPASPVFRVTGSHVVIAADPVFVFSRAHLGAEGEGRLEGLASALAELVQELPVGLAWRIRVEGHTDGRALRSGNRFPTNWELSAARATEVVRYLIRKGIPADRLEAVGLAATAPLSSSSGSSGHRRNRRVELHLEIR